MPCLSPLEGYQHISGKWVSKRDDTIGPMAVKCGQCLGCRIDKRTEWRNRIVHESTQWPTNSFITLTYRDQVHCTEEELAERKHLPIDGSLKKSHHQKFVKKLRKRFPRQTIRYYHCGEYGDENDRPHYHTAFFNLSFDDEVLYSNNHGYPLFTSKTLEELWGYGFCTIGDLTPQSAEYVAGYCLKKVTGEKAHDHYLRYDENGQAYWLQPEYSTMSTGHKKGDSIGATWFRKYHEDVFPSDDLPVPGLGVVRGIPRYYEELASTLAPDSLEEAQAIRKAFAKAHPENYTPERRESQRKIYIANMKRREL